MAVSGLVVVLEADSVTARTAMEALARRDGVTIGDAPETRRVPITIESDHVKDARETQRWIEALPGVCMVEVVFVDFGDIEPPAVETVHNGENIR